MNSVLNAFGGIAGIAAAVAFIIRELLNRRTRIATAEVTELSADELRVKMADNITKNLQIQLDATRRDLNIAREDVEKLKHLVEELTALDRAKTARINLLEDQQELDRRKIFLLEKAAQENGMELPYEVFDES